MLCISSKTAVVHLNHVCLQAPDQTWDESVSRGTLIEPCGARRELYGCLDLTAAIEAALLRAEPPEQEQ